jgi:hypothetical protein
MGMASVEEEDSTLGPSTAPSPNFFQFIAGPANGSSIAKRGWMMKMVVLREQEPMIFEAGDRKEPAACCHSHSRIYCKHQLYLLTTHLLRGPVSNLILSK